MSASYAGRLKKYPNKGVCGLPELPDTFRSLTVKINKLAHMVRHSPNIVIFTGAGISTACGIPDFRGPKGIWTQEQKKKRKERQSKNVSKRQKLSNEFSDDSATKSMRHSSPTNDFAHDIPPLIDFASAKPSITHRAIKYLVRKSRTVQHIITQNVDGLHQRSGISRANLIVLHGCAFTEKCEKCETEHFRDYDNGGIGCQRTGRRCEICEVGALRDTLLDWDDQLPKQDFDRATTACKQADLVICLGTSLRIDPAASLPSLAKKFVIVNLQETARDDEAELVIRGDLDYVLEILMEKLGYHDWDNPSEHEQIERHWKYPRKSRLAKYVAKLGLMKHD